MKEQKITLGPAVLFLSMLGIGFFPWASGTVASFFSIPIILILSKKITPLIAWILVLALIIFSGFLMQQIQKKNNTHDPSWMVFDEFLGQWVTFLICPTFSLIGILINFLLFRFFDIVKVWPASWFDRKNNGLAVVLDDIVAGIYAGTVAVLLQSYLI